ncbi:hypothetical protein MODO_3117 [Myroides odoratimimus]|uniref:hypothetical protein n=1 Tax=Myroides odoratimimus TaxID=76832 RepID=UPI00072A50D7|nr:hypothetical protein [Myroides odoratimimus]GAQ15421.1 hypothetical protein MODO_3117 [Myroides odoratimimus]STZ48120.1 Uncharacterised protein [Myroides odoratimimus]
MSQDKHLIIEKDGYPLQIESIQTLNDGIQQSLTNIAAVCGSNTILKGCVDEVKEGVTYVSDGIMCIDGRIFQFKGGKKTGGVTIITDKVDDIYDTGDGSAKQMLPVRGFTYVTNTPQGSTNIAWNSFVRVADLKDLSALVPKVNDMYQHQILAKGYETHSFADVVEGTVPGHIRIDFDKELNTDDYILLISVESLLDTYASNAKHIIIVSSFDHKTTGFRVKASRKEVGERTQFKVHWIVFKK